LIALTYNLLLYLAANVHVEQYSLFIRTALRYVPVFAIANPYIICRLSVCNVGAPYSGG